MFRRMQGRIAIITGGGTGIGAACARLLVASGAGVTVMDRRSEPLRQLAQEINCLAVTGDAAEEADCRRAVSTTIETYGGLDILTGKIPRRLRRGIFQSTSGRMLDISGIDIGVGFLARHLLRDSGGIKRSGSANELRPEQ